MSLLYRNDKPGQHAPSWYADSVPPAPIRPAMAGDISADVAILGAGFTGLWAALTLARAGRRVVVLDAHRVGFGASGRNGGQVHSGFNKDQPWFEERLGETRARALWDLAEAGKAQLREFCATHAPEAAYRPGIAHGFFGAADLAEAETLASHMECHYDYPVEMLDPDAFRDLVKSPLYQGGSVDRAAGHLHPLAYALALAREAEAAGAIIHELTEVTEVTQGPIARLKTPHGTLSAPHAIIAGNSYMSGLIPKVARHAMPINSFIGATEPLPDTWREVIAEDVAVADDRFVVNYYRFSQDRRLLFGGRESYGLGFPADIETALRTRMERLFPQLAGVPFTNVWGGSLSITVHRVPYVTRVAPNILSAAGFSGHGVSLSGMAGRVMGEAVLGQQDGLATFETLPVPRFPGGPIFGQPLLTLAMTWAALRDRIGF